MHILTERFCHPPLCWLVKLNISHREKFFWEYNRESFMNTFSLRWLVWSPSGPYCHQSKTSANVERTLKRTLHCMLKRINKKHLSVKTKKSLVWDILSCHDTLSLSVVCLFNKAYTCWHQDHRSVFMRTSLSLNGMLLLLAQNCFALREKKNRKQNDLAGCKQPRVKMWCLLCDLEQEVQCFWTCCSHPRGGPA